MKPLIINDINSLRGELISVSSALHTNDATYGGPIEGSEHALEHLYNVLRSLDIAVDGEVNIEVRRKLEIKVYEVKRELHEKFEVASIRDNLLEDVERALMNAGNRYGISSEIQAEILKNVEYSTKARGV